MCRAFSFETTQLYVAMINGYRATNVYMGFLYQRREECLEAHSYLRVKYIYSRLPILLVNLVWHEKSL